MSQWMKSPRAHIGKFCRTILWRQLLFPLFHMFRGESRPVQLVYSYPWGLYLPYTKIDIMCWLTCWLMWVSFLSLSTKNAFYSISHCNVETQLNIVAWLLYEIHTEIYNTVHPILDGTSRSHTQPSRPFRVIQRVTTNDLVAYHQQPTHQSWIISTMSHGQ